MSRRAIWLLRASALWAVWVWGVLVRNMAVDRVHSLGFRAVHIGLAVVSLGFAVVTWQITRVASRPRRDRGR